MRKILKQFNNNKMSLTVTRIEEQTEEIIEERPLREDEDFDSFHSSSLPIDKPLKPIQQPSPTQRNNPHGNMNTGMVNETKKNINAGDFSFGISIKKSY